MAFLGWSGRPFSMILTFALPYCSPDQLVPTLRRGNAVFDAPASLQRNGQKTRIGDYREQQFHSECHLASMPASFRRDSKRGVARSTNSLYVLLRNAID